jgi:tetratricopeptide (TPR) repeat protein
MLDLIRQVNWIAFILHAFLVIIITIILLMAGLKTDLSILISAVSYMGLSVILQRTIPRHHRMGFRLLVHKEYEMAALAFEKSWNFFCKNKWLDDYRAILLLSASKISYREMSLINRSLCYWRIGNIEKALESYKDVLKYFPESRLAKEAIDYIENPNPQDDPSDEIESE